MRKQNLLLGRVPQLLLLAAAVGLSGCGKELQVSVRADESLRDSPSTAMVRQVEVNYRDPGGAERFHERIPVTGLAQPVSVSSDRFKEVEILEGGTMEARALTDQGQLVLYGASETHPDQSKNIEIVLRRSVDAPTALHSALLLRVRVSGAPGLEDLTVDEAALSEARRAGRCVPLPRILVPATASRFPRITFEARIKDPGLSIDLSDRDNGGRSLVAGHRLPHDATGDAYWELAPSFAEGMLRAAGRRLRLDFRGAEAEGCFEVVTAPILEIPQLEFVLDNGFLDDAPYVSLPTWSPQTRVVRPIARLCVRNPNPVATAVTLSGTAAWTGGTAASGRVCARLEGGGRSDMRLSCLTGAGFQWRIEVPSNERACGYVDGMRVQLPGYSPDGMGFTNRGVELQWSASWQSADGLVSLPSRTDRVGQ